jgi:hypothetical protein
MTRTTLAHVDYVGLDPAGGGKWVLVCEDHGFIIQDTNKRRLSAWKKHPIEWCEMCAHIAYPESDIYSNGCSFVNCPIHPEE